MNSEWPARKTRLVGALLCLAAMAVLLGACGQEVPPEPTIVRLPTETAQPPTEMPRATATPTQSPVPPTATQLPTSTPKPVPPTPTQPVTRTPQPPTPVSSETLQGRFVFQVASGGDIYVVNADGSGLSRITQGMDPSWSPDGSQIAFVRWTTLWGIYLADADGTDERLLFSSNVARAPAWSPHGDQIAFYFQTEGMTAPWRECIEGYGCITIIPPMLQEEWHLGVVDVDDGYLHQPYCDRRSFSPTWTSDGQWLIYDGGHGLSMTTVEGPNNRPFTDNVQDQFPVTSPDGQRIAFMEWQHDHWEIYVMNADGSGRWPLTSSSALLERRPNNVSPTWSPDGKYIAFLSDRDGEWEFYVMKADGSEQRQILANVTDRLKILYRGANERVISWGPH